MTSTGANAHPGEIIAGRYWVEGWVGQGNMAMVFRATHLGTGRACALKLVHAHLVERPEIQDMFVQEARVGGRIGKNPYIVDVFDAGIDADRGVPFLAMDLLEGMTLDKYIKQYGQMPPGLLKTLWGQLADALEQAHAAGVVHRDLKPGNLFLTYDRKGNPQLRVVDFGIAKLMEEGVQRTATQIGTPAYAAPEQLGNGMRMMAERVGFKVSTTISPATDIWSLGVVTYEMLIGAAPGQLWTGLERGAATDLMVLVATGPAPSATARAGARGILLPPGFDEWLERCLQKNAADRLPGVELAVQNLVALFDAGKSKMATLRLPPSSELTAAQNNSSNTTVLLPRVVPTNSSAPNPPSARYSSSHTDSNPSPAALDKSTSRTQLDSLTGSNAPPSSEIPRIDTTSLGISGTLTPKRTKRSQKLGIGILASIALVCVIVGVVVFPSTTTPTNKTTPTPSAAIISTPPSTMATPNSPKEPIVIISPGPTLMPSAPAPAPSGTLSGHLPTAKTSSSAPLPLPPAPSDSAASSIVVETASLNFNSNPVSNVVLDGRPIGSTPKMGVSVAPGTHTAVFIHPVMGRKTVSVTVAPGAWKTVAVKF